MGRIITQTVFDELAVLGAATITLGGLAAGSSRQSSLITNAKFPSALVYVRIKSGTAPIAGHTYDVFLLRANGAGPDYITDGGGASDAAITIENAQLLGSIVVTNNIDKYFYGDFDTSHLGPLGPKFGFAIRNSTDQSLNAASSEHKLFYDLYSPETT